MSRGGLYVPGRTALTLRGDGSPRDRQTILRPSAAWEHTAVCESSLLKVNGTWYLVYGGTDAQTVEAIGVAVGGTGDLPAGPWVKQSDPIIGNGFGNCAATLAGRSWLMLDGSTVLLYFAVAGDLHGRVYLATGPLPTSLTASPTAVLDVTGSGGAEMGNCAVVKDGATYKMLFECNCVASGVWEMGYATASAAAGPFTVQSFPMRSMQIGTGGMYGGPWLAKLGSTFVAWYHAAPGSGNLPTYLYRAISTDMTNWTKDPVPKLCFGAPWETDQLGDPFLVMRANGVEADLIYTSGDLYNGVLTMMNAPVAA